MNNTPPEPTVDLDKLAQNLDRLEQKRKLMKAPPGRARTDWSPFYDRGDAEVLIPPSANSNNLTLAQCDARRHARFFTAAYNLTPSVIKATRALMEENRGLRSMVAQRSDSIDFWRGIAMCERRRRATLRAAARQLSDKYRLECESLKSVLKTVDTADEENVSANLNRFYDVVDVNSDLVPLRQALGLDKNGNPVGGQPEPLQEPEDNPWIPIAPGCEMPDQNEHVDATTLFNGKRTVERLYWRDGFWRTYQGGTVHPKDVLAWKRRPKPWQPPEVTQ